MARTFAIPPPTLGRLTYAQLEGLWIRAGGPVSQAPTAAAIALAESEGDRNVTNPNDNGGTQTSWGLWQISNGTHSAPSPQWSVPIANARLAVAKWRAAGDSFSPWGTFNSGAYRSHLQGSTTPDFSAAGSAGAPGPGSAASADPGCLVPLNLGISLPIVGSLTNDICLLRKSQARAWLGGLLITGGGLVLFGGAAILIGRGLEQTKAAQIVIQAAGLAGAPGKAAGRQFSRKPAAKTQAPPSPGATATATAGAGP